MFSISGTSSTSTVNSSYLDALVTQAMTYYRRRYDLAKTQRDQLDVTRAIYVDLQSKLNSLDSIAGSLASGSTSVFGNKSITISDDEVVTATATSSATSGNYALSISTLAKVHRVRSEQQAYSDQALGLSGTFIVGGLENRAVSEKSTVADTVTDFDVSVNITIGQRELGSGTYYVEVRDNAGTKEFRLVDEDGTAVSIANVDDASSFTSGWQSLATAAAQTQPYDTGRGLTITFDADGPYTTGMRESGAASVRYDAKGVEVTVTSTNTLSDIASAINNGTYAAGNEVAATIVDRQLILTSGNTGTRHKIVASDKTGTVLSGTGGSGLGILGDGGTGDVDPTDGFKVTLQQAVNTGLTVNGISVTRQSATGLTDVISGVTLNLLQEGAEATADLTIAANTASVTSTINNFLNQFNSLTSYLKTKTDTTESTDGTTYTRGGLAGDSTLYRLRFDLLSDLTRPVPRDGETALPAGDPVSVREIGITMSDSLSLSISDSGKLSEALASNFQGVSRLFDKLMDRITARLEPFTRSVDSLVSQAIETVDDEIEDAEDTLDNMEERMQLQEASFRRQYAALFNQIYAANATQSTLTSMLLNRVM